MAAESLLTFDLHHDPIDTARAAELAGVTPAVIRQWRARGHLTPVARDGRGRPLYLGIDVLHAEHATRRAARRMLA